MAAAQVASSCRCFASVVENGLVYKVEACLSFHLYFRFFFFNFETCAFLGILKIRALVSLNPLCFGE